MPALLTRIAGAPSRAATSASSASTDASLPTSSTAPRPLSPSACSASPIERAPSSLVAVPMTVAPCRPSASAIARPMPRDAPVTSATRPAIPGNAGSAEEISMTPLVERSTALNARDYSRAARRRRKPNAIAASAPLIGPIEMCGDDHRSAGARLRERHRPMGLLERELRRDADREHGADPKMTRLQHHQRAARHEPVQHAGQPHVPRNAGIESVEPRVDPERGADARGHPFERVQELFHQSADQ